MPDLFSPTLPHSLSSTSISISVSTLCAMVVFAVTRRETVPFEGQKPGTSGLRKKVAVPGALFEDKPQSANDTWRKLHSDPLLLIGQREQEALARIKNNPIKMAMIKKSVEDEKKKKQDKKEKKRHKDHHHSRSKDDKRSLRRYSDSGTDLFPSLEFDQAFVSRVDFIRQRFHPCPFTMVLNRFFVHDLNPRMMDAFHLFFFRFF
ncbi:unnamed protein product, partial [Musa hybrid cultivar]